MNKFIRVMVTTVVLIAGIVNAPPQIIRAEPNLPPVPTHPPIDMSPIYPDMRMQTQPPPASRFEITALITETNTLLTNPMIDMKVLVIHGNGFRDSLGLEHPYTTLKSYLDILGIPHDTVDLSKGETIDEADLWDGVNHGHYYAIFFTTNSDWYPGLPSATQEIIAAYERNFGVRQVTLYAYPYPEQSGLTVSSTITPGINGPMTLTLTSAGQSIFSYLQPDIQITMDETIYGYPAISAGDADVTPLIVDENTDIAMAIFRPGDGREHLVFTWSSRYRTVPPNNIHARLLPYGIINWATKGIFLGERHVYFIPQPDDVFFWGDGWDSGAQEITEGTVHRLETTDLDNLVTWMDDLRTNTPNAADFKMEMPFNGEGTEQDREDPLGAVISDTLTAKAIELKDEFIWLNHTYTHVDLDPPADETTAHNAIKDNNDLAVFLTLTNNYTTRTLLTGGYSGLTNPDVITAAYNLGIRYMLVDASDAPTYTNPSPNTGIVHTLNPEVLLVPRHANNIFYFAVTPQDETEYYNIRYPGESLNYEEIIDVITNQSLENLLDFNVNPTMFHMNNVIAYNATTQTNTILSDFVEALYGKYNALYNDNVPILSLSTEEIGEKMRERMAYNDSGVSAVWSCGDAITLTTTGAAIIPITGINATQATYTESYAGQDISYFNIEADDVLFIPGAPTSIPEQINGLSVVVSDTQNVLTWNAVATDTNGAPVQALFYRVYRNGILLAESLTATVYTDTSPIPGATYAITALGDNCWKLESEDASATPTTLLDFTTSTLAETVTITWTTDIETNTAGFNLYRATTIDGPWTRLNAEVIPSKAGGVYTATDTGDEGQRLYYRIEEIEIESTGSASLWYSPSHADIGIASTPYQITNLSLDIASDQNVLSWNETVSDTTGAALNALVYRVYTNTDAESTPSSSTLIAEVAKPIFTDTTPITGVTYLVTAIGANEWRRESSAVRATPTRLLNFSAGVIAGAVTVTWTTDVETHTQHFNLYISTPSDPTWTLIGTENTKGSGIYIISDPNNRHDGTFSYRLEEVEVTTTGNAKLWYPSISVDIGPNAVSLMRLQAQSTSVAIWVRLGGVLLVVGSVFGVKRARLIDGASDRRRV